MFTEPEKLGLGAFPLGSTTMGSYAFTAVETIEQTEGVRFLDLVSGDYATRDGKILKTSATKQRVVNLLAHRFGTSVSVRGVRSPDVHDAYTQRFVDAEVRTVLRPLTVEGAIVVKKVDAVTDPRRVGRLGVSVEFVDTATGRTETAEA